MRLAGSSKLCPAVVPRSLTAQPITPDESKVNTIHRKMTLSLFESVVHVGIAVVTALVE